jgi:hypothetical protein
MSENDMSSNAPRSSIAQLLKTIGSELTCTKDGAPITRAEALARNLWTLAEDKEVTLRNGTIVRASNNEWLEICFRVIERMEGKPMQPLSGDVNAGLIITRPTRFGNSVFDNTVDRQAKDTVQLRDGTLPDGGSGAD